VEGLKDEVRTVISVGMVDGRCTIFSQVKRAAEALEFELWRSHRNTNTAGSSNTWQATKPTTGASSSGASNHHKTGRYPVPVNAMRSSHKLSEEDSARYLPERLCYGCGKSGHMARACPDKRKERGKRLRKTSSTGSPCVIRG
jgi:Zinc knuckle